MGCHFLFQGTIPTQGLNPLPLHWQGRFIYHWATRETHISDHQVMLHSWLCKHPVPLAFAEADLRSCFPWWLSGKEPTGQCRRPGFNPWVRKIPWRRKWQPTLVFLLGESHGQRSLEGYSPWVAESAQWSRGAGDTLAWLAWEEDLTLLQASESQQFGSLYLGQDEPGSSWENDLQLSWDNNRSWK